MLKKTTQKAPKSPEFVDTDSENLDVDQNIVRVQKNINQTPFEKDADDDSEEKEPATKRIPLIYSTDLVHEEGQLFTKGIYKNDLICWNSLPWLPQENVK